MLLDILAMVECSPSSGRAIRTSRARRRALAALRPMPDPDHSTLDTLEEARSMVWEALRLIEEAQRVLFRAGDEYVREVWGEGVRAIIDTAERLTSVCGELTASTSEIDRLARRDRDRDLS